ncbi:MAG TPA: hypothetical protein V6C72_07770, partial [Chroococcales cyanobacterium]
GDPTKQIGISGISGNLVLIDYPAVGEKGSNSTLNEIIGGTEGADRAYDEENANPPEEPGYTEDSGYGSLNFDVEARRQMILEDQKIPASDRDILKQLFDGFTVDDVAMLRALEQGKFTASGDVDMKDAKVEVKRVKAMAVKQGLLDK